MADTEKALRRGCSGADECSNRRASDEPQRSGHATLPAIPILYRTFPYVPAAIDRNVLGVVGYGGDYPAKFMGRFRSDGAEATFTVVQVKDGKSDPDNPTLEANLNIQYSEAMAYTTPHIFYSTGNGPSGTDDSATPSRPACKALACSETYSTVSR
jgi:hypothetical protein